MNFIKNNDVNFNVNECKSLNENYLHKSIKAMALGAVALSAIGCTSIQNVRSDRQLERYDHNNEPRYEFRHFDAVNKDVIDRRYGDNGTVIAAETHGYTKDGKVIVAVIDDGVSGWRKGISGRDISLTPEDIAAQRSYFGSRTGHGDLCVSAAFNQSDKELVSIVANTQTDNRFSDPQLIFDAGHVAKVISLSIGDRGIPHLKDGNILGTAIGVAHAVQESPVKPMVVMAAGNDGQDNNEMMRRILRTDSVGAAREENPNDVIVVGSCDTNGKASAFSTKGADVYILGENIEVMDRYGKTKKVDGTSFATPKVASILAGYIQKHPGKTNREYKKAILKMADEGQLGLVSAKKAESL